MTRQASLDLVDPRGRLDVAVFRALDQLLTQLAPTQWPKFRGPLADIILDYFGLPGPAQTKPARKARAEG